LRREAAPVDDAAAKEAGLAFQGLGPDGSTEYQRLAAGQKITNNVMAGLDPAIQTHAFRAWMPGSRPGMTVRVTNNEIWY
jgi:hypothetical protein